MDKSIIGAKVKVLLLFSKIRNKRRPILKKTLYLPYG
jgi:hypothetical protein